MTKGALNRNFRNESDAEFETLAFRILNCMEGNTIFESLQANLPAIKTAVDKYSTDLSAARGLGRQPVAQKNKSRASVEELLSSLALMVMAITTDRAELLTSGFILKKQREPRELSEMKNLVLKAGKNSGEIHCSVAKPKGAVGFMHQISDTPEGEERVWVSTPSTSNQYLYTNLVAGKLYAFRTGAFGSKGQLVFTAISTMFAQ
jgi:hypothetical protein